MVSEISDAENFSVTAVIGSQTIALLTHQFSDSSETVSTTLRGVAEQLQ